MSGRCPVSLCTCCTGSCRSRCRAKLPKLSKKLVKIYFASFMTTFSSAFAITMMFPFLPFMVEFLLPWLLEDETQVATYAGIVASAMFAGRVFSSYIWGTIADRRGRKPVILVSLVLMGLSSAIFGFSVNFAMAVIFRFLVGLTNGVIATMKAVVSEISDDSTQAFGLSIVGASWGLGIIVGPAVSGAISDPIGQYNLTIDNVVIRDFLTMFPYSLPCLLNLLICLLAAVLYFFMVPETLGMKKNRRRSEIAQKEIELARKNANISSSDQHSPDDREVDDSESAALILNEEHQPTTNHHVNTFISSQLVTSSPENNTDNLSTNEITVICTNTPSNHLNTTVDLTGNGEVIEGSPCNPSDKRSSDAESLEVSDEGDKDGEKVEEEGGGSDDPKRGVANGRRLSWGQIQSLKAKKSIKNSLRAHCLYLWDKSVFLSVLMYCTFSFALIGWNEVFPVWAKTSPHLGGLGFSLAEIGIALTVAGVLYLPFSLFLYPLLERRFGSIKSFYGSVIIMIPIVMLFPNIHYLSPWKGVMWFAVCLALTVNQVAIGVAISCSILFINNSVTFDKLGAVNGLATALTSFGRALAPIVSGGLFTVSLQATLSGYGYPLDYRLIFLIFGAINFVCILFVSCLPVSINKQKIIEDVE